MSKKTVSFRKPGKKTTKKRTKTTVRKKTARSADDWVENRTENQAAGAERTADSKKPEAVEATPVKKSDPKPAPAEATTDSKKAEAVEAARAKKTDPKPAPAEPQNSARQDTGIPGEPALPTVAATPHPQPRTGYGTAIAIAVAAIVISLVAVAVSIKTGQDSEAARQSLNQEVRATQQDLGNQIDKVVLGELTDALRTSDSYSMELNSARQVSAESAELTSSLDALEANAETGVPTVQDLHQQFRDLEIVDAGMEGGSGSWYQPLGDWVSGTYDGLTTGLVRMVDVTVTESKAAGAAVANTVVSWFQRGTEATVDGAKAAGTWIASIGTRTKEGADWVVSSINNLLSDAASLFRTTSAAVIDSGKAAIGSAGSSAEAVASGAEATLEKSDNLAMRESIIQTVNEALARGDIEHALGALEQEEALVTDPEVSSWVDSARARLHTDDTISQLASMMQTLDKME